MTRLSRVAIFVVLALLAGCSAVQVSQDYRQDIVFSWYRTYAWKAGSSMPPEPDILTDNPLLHDRFHQAIDVVLARHGYILQAPPDFLVSYEFRTESRFESDPYSTRFGAGFGRRYRYGEFGFGDYMDINQYNLGILAITFTDAKSGKVIWRGVGSERYPLHASPDETTAYVDRMVTQVLAQFPPR